MGNPSTVVQKKKVAWSYLIKKESLYLWDNWHDGEFAWITKAKFVDKKGSFSHALYALNFDQLSMRGWYYFLIGIQDTTN